MRDKKKFSKLNKFLKHLLIKLYWQFHTVKAFII